MPNLLAFSPHGTHTMWLQMRRSGGSSLATRQMGHVWPLRFAGWRASGRGSDGRQLSLMHERGSAGPAASVKRGVSRSARAGRGRISAVMGGSALGRVGLSEDSEVSGALDCEGLV
eukprot:scaffold64227_cov26-Tisochrysis_lutea.AAC.1